MFGAKNQANGCSRERRVSGKKKESEKRTDNEREKRQGVARSRELEMGRQSKGWVGGKMHQRVFLSRRDHF